MVLGRYATVFAIVADDAKDDYGGELGFIPLL